MKKFLFSFLSVLFFAFVIALFTVPGPSPQAQVTVASKGVNDTLNSTEFNQITNALKGLATQTANMVFDTTCEIPNGPTIYRDASAAQVANSTGQVFLDTTDNVLIVSIGNATKAIAHQTFQHHFMIHDATNSLAGLTVGVWIAPKDMAVTVTQISASSIGAGTLAIQLTERAFASIGTGGTAMFSANTEVDQTGLDVTSFSNAGLAAKSHVVLNVAQATGTVTALSVVIYYEKNIE